jgi:hypothetical protein
MVPILVPLGVAAALGLEDGVVVVPADGVGLLDEAWKDRERGSRPSTHTSPTPAAPS